MVFYEWCLELMDDRDVVENGFFPSLRELREHQERWPSPLAYAISLVRRMEDNGEDTVQDIDYLYPTITKGAERIAEAFPGGAKVPKRFIEQFQKEYGGNA